MATGRRRVAVVNGFRGTGAEACFRVAQLILRRADIDFDTGGGELAAIDAAIAAHRGKETGPDWLLLRSDRWMPGEDDRDVVALFTTRESPTGVTAEEAAW